MDNALPGLELYTKAIRTGPPNTSPRIPLNYMIKDVFPSLLVLEKSATNGCQFCAILRDCIRSEIFASHSSAHQSPLRISFEYLLSPYFDFTNDGGYHYLIVCVYLPFFDGGKDKICHLLFSLNSTDDNICTWLGVYPPPDKDPLSSKNISRLKHEITQSLKKCCSQDFYAQLMPKRLLDLGDTQARVPCLVATDQSDRNSQYEYAALSYCWGDKVDADRNLKLTTQSLAQFQNEIPVEIIPAVIKDAIAVCRAFSIRYLWVDTLCILQNNESDWHDQSQNMGHIYGQSLVTIYALASSNCNEGFLPTRSSIAIPFESRINPDITGQLQIMYLGIQSECPSFGIYNQLDIDMEISKWGTRGWCFQEETMAPRQIFFGKQRAHYRCGHMTYSENITQIGNGFFPFSKVLEDFNNAPSSSDSLLQLYSWWHSSVGSTYNTLSLSIPEDKLPAISGLAREVATLTKDQYVAGLWRNELRGLIWQGSKRLKWNEHLEYLRAPDPSNLPTWSWLKHNCYCSFGTLHFPNLWQKGLQLECEIRDIHVDLVASNPFGRIKKAVLSIFGQIVPFTFSLIRRDTTWSTPPWDVQTGEETFYSAQFDWEDGIEAAINIPDGLMMLKVATMERKPENDLKRDNSEDDNSNKEHQMKKDIDYGLFLYPTESLRTYYRVGVFSTHRNAMSCHDPFEDIIPQDISII